MATMVGTQKDVATLLNGLIELDLDAVEAYRVAVDRIDDEADKAQLTEFMADHQRHAVDLQALVAELGSEPVRKPDIKRVLTKGKVLLAAIAGDRAILLAMKTNEDDTNDAYDRALGRDDLSVHVRNVLDKNREDERRHRAFIEQRLDEIEGEKEVQEGAKEPEAVPRGESTPGLR